MKLKSEIIWTGMLPHLSVLPHLPEVPRLHLNRPWTKLKLHRKESVKARMWSHRRSNSRPRTPKVAHHPTVPSMFLHLCESLRVFTLVGASCAFIRHSVSSDLLSRQLLVEALSSSGSTPSCCPCFCSIMYVHYPSRRKLKWSMKW